MMKDFSQDLIVTRRHVEQMVGQMMTRLASIRLARSVADKVEHIFIGQTVVLHHVSV